MGKKVNKRGNNPYSIRFIAIKRLWCKFSGGGAATIGGIKIAIGFIDSSLSFYYLILIPTMVVAPPSAAVFEDVMVVVVIGRRPLYIYIYM